MKRDLGHEPRDFELVYLRMVSRQDLGFRFHKKGPLVKDKWKVEDSLDEDRNLLDRSAYQPDYVIAVWQCDNGKPHIGSVQRGIVGLTGGPAEDVSNV